MAAPTSTVWELEPHTRAKHEILKRYLQAWVPILSHGRFPEIQYIDGFAGPGRYSKGEQGSPIIALRAALDQRVNIQARVRFLFIEKDRERARVLQEIVNGIDLPSNFRVEVARGQTFETALAKRLESYRNKGQSLPPTFAFIDPFGWLGVPFSAVKEVMSRPSCEVLVTFMYEEINRFIGHPDQEKNFDAFFGTKEWGTAMTLADPRSRNRFLHDLYLRQLREAAGARYVRSFQMRNDKDVTDYYLFFGTKNLLGMAKMKEAMWKVDESGEFTFSDATDQDQLVLFAKNPNFENLRRQILERFQGHETTVGEIEEFVLAETAFRERHYKGQVLKPLEMAEPTQLEVIDPPKSRRIGTYANKLLRLQFAPTIA
ncbi:MAG: three-Cys-motif partner protein TcmP [Proteobacteria bacterium]|nr:three-Cys-motif partner protein TcmP [Pseudomonadota bacterium]